MTCVSKGLGLSADNLSWGPRGGAALVDGIGFTIAAGERLAIVGPNGAGKSTLLRLLYRAMRPRTGEVRLGGDNIWSIKPNLFAQKVAVVLQECPMAFPFSVRDVVLMGRIPWRRGMGHWTAEDRAVTRHSLEHLNLAGLAQRQFASLSGGEKQRVLIARALAQQPSLLILDEPSNHLDIRHQLEILNLLGGLGITVIATLHDINLAAGFATSAGVMRAGRMIACGAPDDVLSSATIADAFGVAATSHPASDGKRRFSFSIDQHGREGLRPE
jgi:iron complex transport system ATP-binding protein